MSRRRILVTNDDGVRSEGIEALAAALRPLGDVLVVAPAREASAVGHALTLHYPLRLEQLGPRTFAVDGTPTDCVNIAVSVILKGLPDLVVSGINKGWNIGDDVTYSGTVSGALEGCLLGVPSLAVSLQRTSERQDFGVSARAAARMARRVLAEGLPAATFLNINVPRVCNGEFRTTTQAKRTHVTQVDERVDPKHRTYYWIDEAIDEWEHNPRTDYHAVRQGFISVTPMQPDMTAHDAMKAVDALLPVAPRAARTGPNGHARKKVVRKERSVR
jgi:5'-nucleotidase